MTGTGKLDAERAFADMVAYINSRPDGSKLMSDLIRKPTPWGEFDTMGSAREAMLAHFHLIQSVTASDAQVTCVDMTPITSWYTDAAVAAAAGGGDDVSHLMRETPIKPPFKNCILGSVGGSGPYFVYMHSVARLSDTELNLAIIDRSGKIAQMVALDIDAEGRWQSYGRLKGYNVPSPIVTQIAVCSLAMFHVKNIGLREVPFPRAIRRRLEKSGMRGPTSYRVLTLRPFAAQEEQNRRRMQTGEMPLHLVRGHFATYTSAAPLFGKYVGTFWRPEHEAGNPAVAVVRKTYKFDLADGDRAG